MPGMELQTSKVAALSPIPRCQFTLLLFPGYFMGDDLFLSSSHCPGEESKDIYLTPWRLKFAFTQSLNTQTIILVSYCGSKSCQKCIFHFTLEHLQTIDIRIRAFGDANWNVTPLQLSLLTKSLCLGILERKKTKISMLWTQFIHWPSSAAWQPLF